MEKTQNFQNHARLMPLFHQVTAPILGINLIWSIYEVVHVHSLNSVDMLLLAIGLFTLAISARLMVLSVQDRVIRLEMRLRMQQVLPPDLRARIAEFTVPQLIALRFAGDDELPELSRRVLDQNLSDGKAIKKMVRNWQADFLRA